MSQPAYIDPAPVQLSADEAQADPALAEAPVVEILEEDEQEEEEEEFELPEEEEEEMAEVPQEEIEVEVPLPEVAPEAPQTEVHEAELPPTEGPSGQAPSRKDKGKAPMASDFSTALGIDFQPESAGDRIDFDEDAGLYSETLKAEINAWKRAAPSTFAFPGIGADDVATLRSVVEAQAAIIAEQQHEIRGQWLYCIRLAQTVRSLKKIFSEKLQKQEEQLKRFKDAFAQYMTMQTDVASTIPLLREKMDIYHNIQANNHKIARAYYDDVTAKLQAMPTNPANIEAMVKAAVAPLQDRIALLEIQSERIPLLQDQLNALIFGESDDAKKGEGLEDQIAREMATFKASAEQTMAEMEEAARRPLQPVPPPEIPQPQVSVEYLTSRRPAKRTREEEVQQPRKRLYTAAAAERAQILSPADYQRISQRILLSQELKVFGDLLISHRSSFPHIDKWVPVELNDWYEAQREVFVKWYYTFANFRRSQLSEADAWRWFLQCHPQKDEVKRLVDAAARAKLKFIAYPSYKVVTPPMAENRVDLAEVERELHVLAGLLRIKPDLKSEEYKSLRKNFYKMYGLSSRL